MKKKKKGNSLKKKKKGNNLKKKSKENEKKKNKEEEEEEGEEEEEEDPPKKEEEMHWFWEWLGYKPSIDSHLIGASSATKILYRPPDFIYGVFADYFNYWMTKAKQMNKKRKKSRKLSFVKLKSYAEKKAMEEIMKQYGEQMTWTWENVAETYELAPVERNTKPEIGKVIQKPEKMTTESFSLGSDLLEYEYDDDEEIPIIY